MAQLISDRRDVDFVLHEQFEVGELARNEVFSEYNKKTIDMVVSEARNLAIKELLPLQKLSDAGCEFDAGTVRVPKEYHKAYRAYCDGEWLAMSDDPDWGGQGMPRAVGLAANEYMFGACNSFMLYHMLSHGAARLVESFGSDAQKEQCLRNMFTGKWSGTMLLTEPSAGSDVGALETVAYPQGDGTYKIVGSKIFISGGEQDMVENIIHPTLARIEGAPDGTRGISLFLVPKYRIREDGTPGEFNDVVCTGIEHKMGLHGNCTCSLTLGGKGECIGTLLGEENKGMAAMFQMMNEARQMVGLQGFANATAAYNYALDYARQRVQTRHMGDPKDAGPANIVRHPDVRRQLMTMKSLVEGMRSLIYYNGMIQDQAKLSTDASEIQRCHDLEEVLTPIIKGYITDKAFEVCSHAVQVYGGYGYVEEYPVAQLLRDARIFQIYEGTNGIQSIDLLGRKMGMRKGTAFMAFLEEIRKTIERAKNVEAVKPLAEAVESVFNRYGEVAQSLGAAMADGKALSAFCFSHPFLEATGELSMAWMLLWRAAVAAPRVGKKKKDDAYYNGQITTAKFFINTQLPITIGRLAAIETMDPAAIEIEDAGLGGK